MSFLRQARDATKNIFRSIKEKRKLLRIILTVTNVRDARAVEFTKASLMLNLIEDSSKKKKLRTAKMRESFLNRYVD